MEKEDKSLLTIALCEYLPYGAMIEYNGLVTRLDTLFVEHIYNHTNTIQELDGSVDFFHDNDYVDIENIKLYLRPMPSMTEKEKAEYCTLQDRIVYRGIKRPTVNEDVANYIKFLKSHYIDYLGLIDKGLAYEDKDNLYMIEN